MKQWFLIYCKAKQEVRAQENLHRQGFEVFNPQIPVKSKRKKQGIGDKLEALFPRYLFLSADPQQQSLAPVCSTLGVTDFVRFGSKYAVASENLINDIKGHAHRLIEQASNVTPFRKGDNVIVNGHGFDDIEAIYENPCGDSRAMILLKIMGNESRVKVPMSCISAR